MKKLNSMIPTSPNGCWSLSGNTEVFHLESFGSNPGCDRGCASWMEAKLESGASDCKDTCVS